MTPEVAAQMQKLIEKGIRLQNFGSASHTPGTTPNETGINPASATDNHVTNVAWSGNFNGNFPDHSQILAGDEFDMSAIPPVELGVWWRDSGVDSI